MSERVQLVARRITPLRCDPVRDQWEISTTDGKSIGIVYLDLYTTREAIYGVAKWTALARTCEETKKWHGFHWPEQKPRDRHWSRHWTARAAALALAAACGIPNPSPPEVWP